jgi:1-acyl-sn-glycerol-3-phosphate acyltransferase
MRRALKFLYSIWVMLVFIIIIIGSFPFVLFVFVFNERTRMLAMHGYLTWVAHTWFFLCGIVPKIYNRHLAKQTRGNIIVCNHASYLDAAIIYTAVPQVFKTLGKIEISKTPIFGIAYKAVCVLIDRSNNMARARSFIKMGDLLKQGVDITIFPEGTFDEYNHNLKQFFDGAFRLAIQTKAKLIPLILIDAPRRMPADSVTKFSPGQSRALFLPAIDASAIKKEDDGLLKEYMYNYMNTMVRYCKVCGVKNATFMATKWLAQNKIM